jgi:hypothetical protein
MEDGRWLAAKSVALFLFDAGTDSGPTYASPNEPTDPRQAISKITGFPAAVGGVAVPVGSFEFTRL